MEYKPVFTIDFKIDMKFLKKDRALAECVERKKTLEILESPEHYKPVRTVLKGNRRVHIGNYVPIY